MSNKTPKPLSEFIFRPGSALNELARRAEAGVDLATTLRGGLAPELAGNLRSAHIQEDGTLVVMAGSPAWAARLRFEEARLLALCAQWQPKALRLKVRVSGSGPSQDRKGQE